MGFWRLKRHSAPPPPIQTLPGGRNDVIRTSKPRISTAPDEHDVEHHHDDVVVRHPRDRKKLQQQLQQQQPQRRFLFPWQRRQVPKRPVQRSWSQSESEEVSPENSPNYIDNNGPGNVESRRPFLRSSQRLRNSQDFDEDEEINEDRVMDPRYRLEPPVKGNASISSYAAASADVTKSFTLSSSSQSTNDTIQNGRNHLGPQNQQNRSKHYIPRDPRYAASGAGNDAEDAYYQTRIIHPNIHKRDIFIDTSRTPDSYQQHQHQILQNNINNNIKPPANQNHNIRPDPDTILDILGETTTKHTNNAVKRPDPIEDMSFPTPKSYYSPCSFTSPRTTTSFNLPSYSVTGSMVYNAREQYGMESRAIQAAHARGANSPFKPTAVPANSILASMLFRTTQLDQPQLQPDQQLPQAAAHHPSHHQRLPPSYGAAARKEEESQSEVSTPLHGDDDEEEEEEEEYVEEEGEHVEVGYQLEPDGKMNSNQRLNATDDNYREYQEPEEEFDPRQYYYHSEDFMNVPDDIIHPQGSGISSVSSVTDMWATVVDHHWNHANSRMIDLLETAMAEKFPGSQPPPHHLNRQLNQHNNYARQSNQRHHNNSSSNNNNNLKNGILYEA